jgi:hypothetical protein
VRGAELTRERFPVAHELGLFTLLPGGELSAARGVLGPLPPQALEPRTRRADRHLGAAQLPRQTIALDLVATHGRADALDLRLDCRQLGFRLARILGGGRGAQGAAAKEHRRESGMCDRMAR